LSSCGSFVSTGVAENTVSILRAEIAKQLSYKSKCYITVITTTGTFTAVKTSTLKLNEKFVSCLEGATLPLK
jgi:phage tail sheath gpL-like